ncbi:hypothetical protein DYY66_0285 [Candidatus Nitrosotalea sp. FS]|uniref:VOC family protein n=1 Tax=Candidatus Nitrosotalea sp. FS TaxID=2341021 RepID=UPI00140B9EA6|nr:VOC family protein [Candidatus Nitrosotalea sp. FS]NHH97241.1 hypothetical protein [Candidatus Nitrosotalea sp. FS]
MSNQTPEQASFLRLVPRFHINNLDLALTFYGKLGFSTTYNDDSLIILSRDGVDLHMHYSPDDPPSCPVWWIEVKNIEDLYQKCLQHLDPKNIGGGKPKEKPWGFKEFFIRDPFGGLILFAEKIIEDSV